MNLYVDWGRGDIYLNIQPEDPNDVFFFSSPVVPIMRNSMSWNSYVKDVTNSGYARYTWTEATTFEELYALHPELLI